MRFSFLFALVCLAASSPMAYGQTGHLRGTVRDEAGASLPGVNVFLDGTQRGAASDRDGTYEIARITPGAYVVVASAIGYRTQRRSVTVQAGTTTTLSFTMPEAMLSAEEVVVTAARRAQRFQEAPVSISVLRPRDLEERHIVSLDQALRYVPGVQMADNQVNIRGSSGFSFNTGSRVLLLLDGMPLLSPDREGIPFDALPLAQVERVEVLKGPGSALYGGGALGGVINVITKDFPDNPETALRLFGGAYEPVRYEAWREQWDDADVPRPFGGGSFTHARRLGRGWGTWLNATLRADEGFTNYRTERDLDAFFKLGWRSQTGLRFDLLTGWTRRKSDSFLYWNGLADPLNPGELNFGGAQATGTNDNLSNLFSLLPAFTHAVSGRLSYALKGRAFGVVVQPLNDDGSPKPISQGTVGLRYGGEVQVDWLPTAILHVTGGAAADALATESSFFQPDDAEREARSQPEGAVFIQADQRLFDRVNLVAGLRYDVYVIEEGDAARKLSPKLNASLPLLDGLTLRLAYGQGFRVPSLVERYVNNQAFLPIVSNLDLRPETSTSYEVGLRGIQPIQRLGTVQVDIAAFWNHYERLVEPTFIPSEQAFQFINLTEARIRGVEATMEAASAGERWVATLGYTFLDADDLSANQPLVFRSRHQVTVRLSGPVMGSLFWGIDYRFASTPERVDTDFSRFVLDADAIPSVRVLDLRLGARWSRFQIVALANNALDYYYVERPAILAPPRHFVLTVSTWL